MSNIPPFPRGAKNLQDPVLLRWLNSIRNLINDAATVVSSPTVDNFASLDANGDVQDSGYDATSFIASNATIWKSRLLKPESVKLSGVSPPQEDNIDGFSFDRFDRGNEESVYYVFVLPEDFAPSAASVKGTFEFVVENPPAVANEAVVMAFEYKRVTEGAVFSFAAGTTSGSITESITAGEAAYTIHATEEGTCATTGWSAGDTILFRFYRDSTNVLDTYENEAAAADNDVWVCTYHLKYLAYVDN